MPVKGQPRSSVAQSLLDQDLVDIAPIDLRVQRSFRIPSAERRQRSPRTRPSRWTGVQLPSYSSRRKRASVGLLIGDAEWCIKHVWMRAAMIGCGARRASLRRVAAPGNTEQSSRAMAELTCYCRFFAGRFLSAFGFRTLRRIPAPVFRRLLIAALTYRMRGAGPTPPGTEYDRATMPLAGSVFWSVSTSFVEAPGGRSGTPAPRSTGTTATSTVSTRPPSSSDRKSVPPP